MIPIENTGKSNIETLLNYIGGKVFCKHDISEVVPFHNNISKKKLISKSVFTM